MNSRRLFKNYIFNTLYQILLLIAPLITTPYVSRVLGVTNISVYQYTQSIATYFILAGALGTALYGQREIAYLQDRPDERSAAFWEIQLLRMCAIVLVTVIYALIFCRSTAYAPIYRILLIEVAAAAFDVSWVYVGMENFRRTVAANSTVKLLSIASVFLLVRDRSDLPVYTVCLTLPVLLGNLSLWIGLGQYLVSTGLDLRSLIAGIRRRLPAIGALFLPQVAVDVYTVLDRTMIGVLASDIDQVGYYSQAQRIVKLVLAIITSLGTVMLPSMSAAVARDDKESVRDHIRTSFRFTYMLAFAMIFGLCAVAERFVPVFFGGGYGPVAPLMMVISPILLLIGTSNVIGVQYLLPNRRQKEYTASVLTGAGVNFLLNLLMIPRWGAVGASGATVVAELSVALVQCLAVRHELPLREHMGCAIRYAALGAVMYAACRGIDLLLPEGKIWALVIMIITGAAVYAAELLLTKDPILKMGLDMIRNKKTNK